MLGAAMARVRADLAGRPGTRSVVLAHAFVTGGAGQRQRARHQRRRCRVRPGVDLRRASTTSRSGHLHGAQRLTEPCATAARRWPTPSPRSTSARPCCWSSSAPRRAPHRRSSRCRRPCTGRSRAAARPARRPAHRRPLAPARATTGCRSRSPTPVRPREPMERLRAPVPAHPGAGLRARGRGAGADRSYAARLRGRTDLEVAADFVEPRARPPPTTPSPRCCADGLRGRPRRPRRAV